MNKFLGLVVLALGVYLLIKTLFAGWIFLVIAGALALGVATGAVGRWGLGIAGLFVVLALFGMVFKTALWLLFKLAPILLVLYGIYVLLKGFSK